MAELSWLVACDEAEQRDEIRLWVDGDLHRAQAPPGWIQVRTAGEAIALLDRHAVAAVSFSDPFVAEQVVGWLVAELEGGGRNRWPSERVGFHGEALPDWVLARLASPSSAIRCCAERVSASGLVRATSIHPVLRRAGEREWARPRDLDPPR